MSVRDNQSMASKNVTKIVLIDFDGTLTKEHTGGALFVEKADGDRCWRPGTGESTLSSNVASNNAAWTFSLLWNLVMLQNVCVAIITMADERHGEPFEKWLALHPKSKWVVLAGRELVLQWLWCAARVHCDGDGRRATAMIDALIASKQFFVDAHFKKESKAQHVRNAVDHFCANNSLDRNKLRNNDILMIDDSLPLLIDIQKHFQGIEVAPVSKLGLCHATWDLICAKRIFASSASQPNSIDQC